MQVAQQPRFWLFLVSGPLWQRRRLFFLVRHALGCELFLVCQMRSCSSGAISLEDPRIMEKTPLAQLGWEWNWRRQLFEIPCADGSSIVLTPPEMLQLGVHVVLEGTKLMTEQPWQ